MARFAATPRLARILTMVPWVLQHPAQASVEEVCRRFTIDRATLADDLNMLFTSCGIPPFAPGDLIEAQIIDGMVVIGMADYLARPLRLSRWEAVAIIAAGRALASLHGLPEAEALSAALKKLEGAILPSEVEMAALLAERIAIDFEPAPEGLLEELRDAIEHNRTVTIDYFSFGRHEMTERDIDPLLVHGGRPWYVHALDHKSGERRTFRIDRIRSLKQTGRTFLRPDFDPAAAAAGDLYSPSADDVEIVLEIAPGAAWVVEVTPHDGATMHKDGWTQMTLRAGETAWLEHLLLALGASARVVRPPELSQGVRRRALAALAQYQTPEA